MKKILAICTLFALSSCENDGFKLKEERQTEEKKEVQENKENGPQDAPPFPKQAEGAAERNAGSAQNPDYKAR